MLYELRTNLPPVGKHRDITIFNEKKLLNIRVRNIALREITLAGLGTFQAYIIRPKRKFEGIFLERSTVLVWIDKTYKIPLRFIIKLPFGTARIDLVKAENTQTGKQLLP